jgi:mitochondrial fission protein ELM1
MRDAHKITAISISTRSMDPLRGVVTIDTGASTVKFELNEDIAHSICTHLEHFLTQARERGSVHQPCEH